MSIREIKELFFQATNAKALVFGDTEQAETLLRQAIELSMSDDGSIWPKVSAYRLAHLLFRTAKTKGQLHEILELAKLSENTDSEFLKLHSRFIKFAVFDRLNRLEDGVYIKFLKSIQEEIKESISLLQRVHGRSSSGYDGSASLQGNYFNLLEYMTYMSGIDYSPLVGIGYDENNKLLLDGGHDLWRILGKDGFVDEFSYNKEIGLIELHRIVKQEKAHGWYVLGDSAVGNELFKRTGGKPDANTDRIRILNYILKAGSYGEASKNLAEFIRPRNADTEIVKKHRKSIVSFFGKDVFVSSKRDSSTFWFMAEDVKIYGLVNQKRLR